jgi:uncharacterized protein YdiU (UPF0061 family)
MLPGAVLTRIAASHMRVGTFEFFAARGDSTALAALTSYALERHYPDAAGRGNDALALLERVIARQAALVARWLGVGFIHGVMNTDNTSISGETIDYGPCAFLDEYHPHKKFSSIDQGGRYAFANQPRIAQWNLVRLAETLLPLLADDEAEAERLATESLNRFPAIFEAAHLGVLRAKLGLFTEGEGDGAIAASLFERLASNAVDHTLFFRRLSACAADPARADDLAALFADPGALHEWLDVWARRVAEEQVLPSERSRLMRRANPAFIPRNHRIEEMITAAVERADFAPFETLVRILERPYDDQPEYARFAEPPRPEERVHATFCGT